MTAPEGNEFWKMRSKHGRDKIFATPESLWAACVEYFEYTDSRKWVKRDWVGKNAKEVKRETSTPYTIKGLCLFLGVNKGYLQELKESNNSPFAEVITQIEDIIFVNKFEGAAVGAYNSSIVARDLGLVERRDHTTDGEKITIGIPPEKVQEIIDKINKNAAG